MNELHDIEGLDPISYWPLASGWWMVIALIAAILFAIGWFLIKKWNFHNSWRKEALVHLDLLEKNLSEASCHETLITLSETMRRIALMRFPRSECAALNDEDWLDWLQKHDPAVFQWREKGQLLIKAPYAPRSLFSVSDTQALISALKKWCHS